MSLPSNMSSVMTSTMKVGNKGKKQNVCLEDLSAIKTRESLDPRQSVQNKVPPYLEAGGVHRKIEDNESRHFKHPSQEWQEPVSSGQVRWKF